METTVKIRSNSRALKLIVLTSVFCCLGIISLTLHVSPLKFLEILADFAAHHYLVAGFSFLLLATISLQLYYKSKEKTGGLISGNITRSTRRKIAIANWQKRSRIRALSDQSTYIGKEKISTLTFQAGDVLQSELNRRERFESLQKALSLGNLYKQKVIICFKAANTLQHTLGTVWQLDENFVSLKGGAVIPVQRIIKLEI